MWLKDLSEIVKVEVIPSLSFKIGLSGSVAARYNKWVKWGQSDKKDKNIQTTSRPSLSHRKENKCIARKAIESNLLISAGRLPSRPRETWRRTVARDSKISGKSWKSWRMSSQPSVLEDRRYRHPMSPMGSRMRRRRTAVIYSFVPFSKYTKQRKTFSIG